MVGDVRFVDVKKTPGFHEAMNVGDVNFGVVSHSGIAESLGASNRIAPSPWWY